jgi:ABC-type transporter Mla subunit MlaD
MVSSAFRSRRNGRNGRKCSLRLAVALGALAAVASSIAACGPPPFVVHVLFPGEVEVERGTPVLYQGIVVGEVASVGLRQESPRSPAQIAVSLEISDRAVILRRSDRFHLSEHRGLRVVEIAPVAEPSPPLLTGATVAGVPPLVTRAEASIAAAIESLGAIVLDRLEGVLDELSPPPEPEEGSRAMEDGETGAPADRAPTPQPEPSSAQDRELAPTP